MKIGDWFDLAFIGAGPAAESGAIHARNEGIRTMVFEGSAMLGGQAGQALKIINYLGFPDGISGLELVGRGAKQAANLKACLKTQTEIQRITRVAGGFRLTDQFGENHLARRIVVAVGADYRSLDIDTLPAALGHGAQYGLPAMHEPYTGNVFVVGGANSAGQAVLTLSDSCSTTIVVRGSDFSAGMSAHVAEQIRANPAIQVLTNTQVVECVCGDHLEQIVLETNGVRQTVSADHLFILIGAKPRTGLVKTLVGLDDRGAILTGTAVPPRILAKFPGWVPLGYEASPGISAAGDCRHGSLPRVAFACAEGAGVAAQEITWRNDEPRFWSKDQR
jgi:thioredoxin reductase (NADPH)